MTQLAHRTNLSDHDVLEAIRDEFGVNHCETFIVGNLGRTFSLSTGKDSMDASVEEIVEKPWPIPLRWIMESRKVRRPLCYEEKHVFCRFVVDVEIPKRRQLQRHDDPLYHVKQLAEYLAESASTENTYRPDLYHPSGIFEIRKVFGENSSHIFTIGHLERTFSLYTGEDRALFFEGDPPRELSVHEITHVPRARLLQKLLGPRKVLRRLDIFEEQLFLWHVQMFEIPKHHEEQKRARLEEQKEESRRAESLADYLHGRTSQGDLSLPEDSSQGDLSPPEEP